MPPTWLNVTVIADAPSFVAELRWVSTSATSAVKRRPLPLPLSADGVHTSAAIGPVQVTVTGPFRFDAEVKMSPAAVPADTVMVGDVPVFADAVTVSCVVPAAKRVMPKPLALPELLKASWL